MQLVTPTEKFGCLAGIAFLDSSPQAVCMRTRPHSATRLRELKGQGAGDVVGNN